MTCTAFKYTGHNAGDGIMGVGSSAWVVGDF